ncbi:MAG: hypothetical protein PQJ46_09180 [Spirochaetales bacterium]|nr:hypothetical protein [Spirochaetales bacterium]
MQKMLIYFSLFLVLGMSSCSLFSDDGDLFNVTFKNESSENITDIEFYAIINDGDGSVNSYVSPITKDSIGSGESFSSSLDFSSSPACDGQYVFEYTYSGEEYSTTFGYYTGGGPAYNYDNLILTINGETFSGEYE